MIEIYIKMYADLIAAGWIVCFVLLPGVLLLTILLPELVNVVVVLLCVVCELLECLGRAAIALVKGFTRP